MSDLISRQAAIDAINRYCSVWMEYTEVMSIHEIAERALKASKQSMTKILHDLPSAQPEPMCVAKVTLTDEQVKEAFEKAKSEILTVLDAQPRPRGRWQITDAYPHNVHCSVCHKRFAQTHWDVWEDGTLPRNFCPNCGADMREEEQDD